uniref:Uncharacterized protein n=1 Tax=Macrostomum lignano TaxID=282301 RepID=A0A1I8JRB2_9PLAT
MAFKLIFLWLFWLLHIRCCLLLGFLSFNLLSFFYILSAFYLFAKAHTEPQVVRSGTKDLFYTTDEHGNKVHQQPRLCFEQGGVLGVLKANEFAQKPSQVLRKTIGNLSRRQSRSYSATEDEAYRRISAENRPPSSLASSDEFQVSSSHPTSQYRRLTITEEEDSSETVGAAAETEESSGVAALGSDQDAELLESLNALKSAETVEDEAIEDDDKPKQPRCQAAFKLLQLTPKAARLSEAEPLLHDDSDSPRPVVRVQLTIRNFPEELISPGRVGARELETVQPLQPTGSWSQTMSRLALLLQYLQLANNVPMMTRPLQLRRRQAPSSASAADARPPRSCGTVLTLPPVSRILIKKLPPGSVSRSMCDLYSSMFAFESCRLLIIFFGYTSGFADSGISRKYIAESFVIKLFLHIPSAILLRPIGSQNSIPAIQSSPVPPAIAYAKERHSPNELRRNGLVQLAFRLECLREKDSGVARTVGVQAGPACSGSDMRIELPARSLLLRGDSTVMTGLTGLPKELIDLRTPISLEAKLNSSGQSSDISWWQLSDLLQRQATCAQAIILNPPTEGEAHDSLRLVLLSSQRSRSENRLIQAIQKSAFLSSAAMLFEYPADDDADSDGGGARGGASAKSRTKTE